MEYRKIFLDTCILSEIGRMKKEDRGSLAYKFLVTDKLKVILTPFNLIEIEDMPDEVVKKNIYDFLDLSFVGFTKNSDSIFREEIEKYFSNDLVEPIEFNLSYLQKDKYGKPFNFKTFKNALFENSEFKNANVEHNRIINELQNIKRPLEEVDDFFKLIVFHRISGLDKEFLKLLNGELIDFNKIPSFIVWAYSYASKIGSSGLKKKAKEMNDVSMSYIAPYVDIIVTEAKQVERYREIKEKGLINSLNNKIIKKYNEVIIKDEERILFNL